MHVDDILKKARAAETLTHAELVVVLGLAPDSPETYRVMAEASRIAKEVSGGAAEVHAQFAVQLAPCRCDCLFCSFAGVNGIFSREHELSPEQAVRYARQFESAGAGAVYIMATAQYSSGRFIEMGQEIRRSLRPETVLIANIGDQSPDNAKKLKDAGFAGVYHALRLREGIDTKLSPAARRQSIAAFKEAGLGVGTCVEPVGPEHTDAELADMIQYTASFSPAYSGAARRIPIPGTSMGARGTISELRMAQIVAVTRLGMPRTVMGNCTHEPCTLGAIAGANLFWAEVGANPRDIREKTEEGRGETVSDCQSIFRESGWGVWEKPSRYFG